MGLTARFSRKKSYRNFLAITSTPIYYCLKGETTNCSLKCRPNIQRDNVRILQEKLFIEGAAAAALIKLQSLMLSLFELDSSICLFETHLELPGFSRLSTLFFTLLAFFLFYDSSSLAWLALFFGGYGFVLLSVSVSVLEEDQIAADLWPFWPFFSF